MIGATSRGRSFAALGRYLAAGRDGTRPERVDWVMARNLATDDLALAPRIMAATAARSRRVQKPCYHLAISFAPEDRPTPARMRRAADHVLEALGLSDHQAIMVAHNDTRDDVKGEGRGHEHVHLMVNRVHPETGKAWAGRHDYARIEQALRAHELAHGLRHVPGPHSGLEPAPGRRQAPTRQERQLAVRAGEEPLSRLSRESCRKLKESLERTLTETGSWGDLEARLARRGLRLAIRGQGLAVVRGGAFAKLSDLMPPRRKVKDLVSRFGSYAKHLARQRPAEVPEGPKPLRRQAGKTVLPSRADRTGSMEERARREARQREIEAERARRRAARRRRQPGEP